VFLGGINVMSGNKPPWTLPAKAAYGVFDGDRAKQYFGAQDIRTPAFFPILSILVSNTVLQYVVSIGFPNGRSSLQFLLTNWCLHYHRFLSHFPVLFSPALFAIT
jgi:hypothetical protein